MISFGEKLIQQSDDFVLVCAAKTNLSSAYLRKGEYSAAKKILESLPYSVATRNVQISFQLSGEDRYSAASDVYTEEIQSLYIACAQKGKGCYEVGRYEEGLECYQKEEQVILLFMRKNEISPEAYLWDGMQTHHWFSHLGQAACWNKLGNSEKCTEHVMIAKKIISKAWNDFEADRKCYMTPFNQYLCELELDQFTETL